MIKPPKLRAGTGTREEGVLASWQVLLSLKGHREIVSISAGEKQVLSLSSRLAISLWAASKRTLAGRGENWLTVSQPGVTKELERWA